jgi:hypothetical protein
VTMQLVASLGAVFAENFYVFQAVRKGCTAKVNQFRQLQSCIAQLFSCNHKTFQEIETGFAWLHAFTVTLIIFLKQPPALRMGCEHKLTTLARGGVPACPARAGLAVAAVLDVPSMRI